MKITGTGREVDENCALLGYYASISGNFLPTFRDNLSVPSRCVITQKSAVLKVMKIWVL